MLIYTYADEHISCPGRLEAGAYGTRALYLRTKGQQEEAFLLEVLGMFQGACGDRTSKRVWRSKDPPSSANRDTVLQATRSTGHSGRD